MRRPNPVKLQECVDKFNGRYPVGTKVTRFRLIKPLRDGVDAETRSPAWVMGGHSAMVMVKGISGGVVLESIVPVDESH